MPVFHEKMCIPFEVSPWKDENSGSLDQEPSPHVEINSPSRSKKRFEFEDLSRQDLAFVSNKEAGKIESVTLPGKFSERNAVHADGERFLNVPGSPHPSFFKTIISISEFLQKPIFIPIRRSNGDRSRIVFCGRKKFLVFIFSSISFQVEMPIRLP